MFEQSILAGNSRNKAWTLGVSLVVQTSLILIAALIPLIYTDKLPGLTKWVGSLAAPVPPAAPPRAPQEQVVSRAPNEHRVFTAPPRIPKTVTSIVDDPAKFVPETPAGPVVVGATGSGIANGLNRLISDLLVQKPAPPPTPVSPAPPNDTMLRVSQGVQEAKLLRKVLPIYPPLAITARVQGTVHLVGVIAKDGTIRDLRVIDGSPLLVRAALDAVRQWIYKPTLLSGETVEVVAPISVTFTLNR